MLALTVIMSLPAWEIERCFPRTTLRTYVENRMWASPTAKEALQVEAVWGSWSSLFQFRESQSKSQYYHKTIKGRRKFCNLHVHDDKITDKPIILGTVFRGAQQTKHTTKEDERIDKSIAFITRAAFLPVPLDQIRLIVAGGLLSEAEFGWFLKPPNLT